MPVDSNNRFYSQDCKNLLASIGEVVRDIVNKSEKTAIDAAEEAGLDRKTLANIVSGKKDMKISSLVKLAESMEVPPGELFTMIGDAIRAEHRKHEADPLTVVLERDGMDRVKVVVSISRIKFNNLFSNDQEN